MSMTANLQQRQRKRPTRLDRGSMTRSNVASPPALLLTIASNNPQHLGPRWQSAATTPLSPAPYVPESSGPLRPHHSSFVIHVIRVPPCCEADVRLRG